jgi:hypothetical protein
MRKHYDFSHAEKNPHAKDYKKGSNLVILDPDVAKIFPDSESVNRALRLVGNGMSGAPSARNRIRKRKVG